MRHKTKSFAVATTAVMAALFSNPAWAYKTTAEAKIAEAALAESTEPESETPPEADPLISIDYELDLIFGFATDNYVPAGKEYDHFFIAEGEIEIERKFGEGYAIVIGGEVDEYEYYGDGHPKNGRDLVGYIEGVTPIGTLTWGGINKKGASELFYNDLDSMAIDVVRYRDRYNSLRWHGDAGPIEYAVSSRNLQNDDKDEISLGMQYEIGSAEIGLVYDKASNKQDKAIGASVEYAHDLQAVENTYKISYISKPDDDETSLGIAIETDFKNGFESMVHYAKNDVENKQDAYGLEVAYENDDLEASVFWMNNPEDIQEYGFEVEYEKDNWKIEAEYEHTDDNIVEAATEVAYTMPKFAPAGTRFALGYEYEEDAEKKTGAFGSIEFGLTENYALGIAYSGIEKSGAADSHQGNAALYLHATFD